MEVEFHTEETKSFIKQARRLTKRKFTPKEKIRIVPENSRHEVKISGLRGWEGTLAMNKPEGCPRTSVIICTLNEEQNLPYVLPKIPQWIDEILLVDGHSIDRTIEVAKALRPEIRVLYQQGRGKGDALKYGIKHASGDIIVTLDADGATEPEQMSEFIEPLLNSYDFAKGSRFLNSHPNMPLHRRFGNWVLTTVANLLFGTKYTDICSGYNAFWKKVINDINLFSNGFEMEQEMNVKIKKAGLKIIEVPCQDKGRISGSSKVSGLKQGLNNLKTIVVERFRG